MTNKKLYRSRTDYVLTGVAGGLAEFFQIDSTIVRLIFVAMSLGGGSGLLVYIILALVIPREPGEIAVVNKKEKVRAVAADVGQRATELVEEIKADHRGGEMEGRRTVPTLGIALIVLGLLLLVNKLIPIHLEGDWFWPIVLVGLGGYLLIK
ncbi:MAG: PspC domain-containing protein [Candidatus Shapirobacteria bacterium]|jgi:phage shock protein PspC (stress-responsive transcriptional regulator)